MQTQLRHTLLLIPFTCILLGWFSHDMVLSVLAKLSFLALIVLVLPDVVHRMHHKRSAKHVPPHQMSDTGIVLGMLGCLLIFATYVGIAWLQTTSGSNGVEAYFTAYEQFIVNRWLVVGLILMVIVGGSMVLQRRKNKKHQRPADHLLFVRTSTFALLFFVASVLMSCLTTYAIGWVHANILSLQLLTMPGSVGMVWDSEAIADQLANSRDIPSIVSAKSITPQQFFSFVAKANSDHQMYQQQVLAAMTNALLVPVTVPDEPVTLAGNTLIIKTLDADTISAASPIIARKLLANYFPNRYLKDDPDISLVGRQDYLAYRQQEINAAVSSTDDAVKKVTATIADIQDDMAQVRSKLVTNQTGVEQSQTRQKAAYANCLNAVYKGANGQITHVHTQEECDTQVATWNTAVAKFQANVTQWNTALTDDQKQLEEAQATKTSLEQTRTMIKSQQDVTPQELGAFVGPSTIALVMDSVSPNTIAVYLETLVHENLHYQSYISDERTLNRFFEEGLTEYFARRVMEKAYRVRLAVGYPVLTKVIDQMATKIPEKEFEDIYFTKDASKLEQVIDAAYGKGFYKASQNLFLAVSYASPDQAVPIANTLLEKLGGHPLTTHDVSSLVAN